MTTNNIKRRYYVLALDVRTDALEVILTAEEHSEDEMQAVRASVRMSRPHSLVMFRPYTAVGREALLQLIARMGVKVTLPLA